MFVWVRMDEIDAKRSRRFILRLLSFSMMVGLIVGAWLLFGNRGRRDGLEELKVEELGHFDFDQQAGTAADVPERIRRLDGQRIALVGEMWDPDPEMKTWKLTKSYGEHQPPLVQRFVFCRSASPVPFVDSDVRVTGVLHIGPVRQADGVAQLFRMDVESVRADDGR